MRGRATSSQHGARRNRASGARSATIRAKRQLRSGVRPVRGGYSGGPVPRTMTATRRQTVFAGLDQPSAWPRTPRAPRPERLELGLETLPGVGATMRKKLASLGLETVRDVLEHRPRRYETAADEVTIASLQPGEEVVIRGRVLTAEK